MGTVDSGYGTISGVADGSSTAIEQYSGVVRSSGNTYVVASAADQAIDGVVTEKVTDAEQSITINVSGRTKVLLGGSVTAGDPVTVAADAEFVEAVGTATVTSGANTSLDYTEKDAYRGKVKAIKYVDPGQASHTGYVEYVDGVVVAYLSTNSAGTITETADSLKTLFAANATITAALTIADTSGHDGSGTLTAEPAVNLTGASNIFGIAEESGSAGEEIMVRITRGGL